MNWFLFFTSKTYRIYRGMLKRRQEAREMIEQGVSTQTIHRIFRNIKLTKLKLVK